jgi:hypothetical protein
MRREILSLFAGVGLCLTAGVAAWAGPLIGKPHAPELVVPIWSLTGECYPIDFTGVDIEWYAGRNVYQLTVTSVKPYMNMDVLSHEAYSGRPAYWRTLVVGCVKNGLVLRLAAPYYLTMNLDQFVGSKGVEIVGASRKIHRDVPKS